MPEKIDKKIEKLQEEIKNKDEQIKKLEEENVELKEKINTPEEKGPERNNAYYYVLSFLYNAWKNWNFAIDTFGNSVKLIWNNIISKGKDSYIYMYEWNKVEVKKDEDNTDEEKDRIEKMLLWFF